MHQDRAGLDNGGYGLRLRPVDKDGPPDHGWFWWTHSFAPGWTAHMAKGWKGQRIAVFPAQGWS
jgi:hypothetical protein